MRIPCHTITLLAITCALAKPASVTAQDADPKNLFQRGNYEESLELIENKSDPSSVRLAAECLESLGRYAEAIERIASVPPDKQDAPLLTLAARLQRRTGQWPSASASIDRALKADADYIPARWEKFLVTDAIGNPDDIPAQLEFFIDFYNDKQPTDAETLVAIAKGASEFARRNKLPQEFDFILNTLLADAKADDEFCWEASALAGMLLLEKYNKAEALPELNAALKINPNAVDAIVGLGLAAQREWDFPAGFSAAKRALEVNPHSEAALCLEADLLALDERVDEAIERLDRAAKINPNSQEILGRKTACLFLKNTPDAARQIEEQARSLFPRPGVYYARLGGLLEERRQFPEAERTLRQAVEIAPHLAEPRNQLGMLFMRIGKEDEARAVLEEASKLDPFHVRIANMKKVLSHLEKYQILKSEHYELKVTGERDSILAPYMLEHLEDIHPILVKRFGYEPPTRTTIEIMQNHQWFSARVVGLPSIGTVGACTGDVVALASPESLEKGYNWARVLTHEVTHVFTLQQTAYRIPHWFTEALAVMSEGYPRPQVWNDLLAERVPKRELFNLDTINHAFVRPKTQLDWQMAYCQANLYAEMMVAKGGEEALGKMLTAYREGIPTEVAIRDVFGISKLDFERDYVAFLDGIVSDLKGPPPNKYPTLPEAAKAYEADPNNLEAGAELAVQYVVRSKNKQAAKIASDVLAKQPDHPGANYVMARLEWSIGKPDAAAAIIEQTLLKHPENDRLLELLAAVRVDQKRYKDALAIFQQAHQRQPTVQKWVEGIVKMALKVDDRESLVPALELLARMDADNAEVRQKLADLAKQRSDWPSAARWAIDSLQVSVRSTAMHRLLAETACRLEDFSTAAREYEVLEKLDDLTLEDQIALVQAYKRVGENDKAKGRWEKLHAENPKNDVIEQLGKDLGAQ